MIKTIVILIIVFVLLAALLIYAATRPDTFRVERSASIRAPAERIFALLNDFHRWPAWSPWEKMDPAMRRAHGGAEAGRGAIYEWDGNSKVGKGRMEILESTPSSRIRIKLDFVRPFEGHNTAEYKLEPKGDSTQVTWAMYGPSPYMAKVMGIFTSMDTMIGKDFEAGLANLKALAEQ